MVLSNPRMGLCHPRHLVAVAQDELHHPQQRQMPLSMLSRTVTLARVTAMMRTPMTMSEAPSGCNAVHRARPRPLDMVFLCLNHNTRVLRHRYRDTTAMITTRATVSTQMPVATSHRRRHPQRACNYKGQRSQCLAQRVQHTRARSLHRVPPLMRGVGCLRKRHTLPCFIPDWRVCLGVRRMSSAQEVGREITVGGVVAPTPSRVAGT